MRFLTLLTILYTLLVKSFILNKFKLSNIKLDISSLSDTNFETNLLYNTKLSELEFLDLFYEDNHRLKFTYYSFYKSDTFPCYHIYIKYITNFLINSEYFPKYSKINPRKALYFQTLNKYFERNI
jgi:hypothetical protein